MTLNKAISLYIKKEIHLLETLLKSGQGYIELTQEFLRDNKEDAPLFEGNQQRVQHCAFPSSLEHLNSIIIQLCRPGCRRDSQYSRPGK